MDSEQAIWAKQWIQSECDLSAFEKGWTYMFEIIYTDNTVVIDYPFEGLVLLAVTNADGVEIPSSNVYDIAKRVGFTLASHPFRGIYSQIKEYCGERKEKGKRAVPSPLPDDASREGWVIRADNGCRTKQVSNRYKARSRQSDLIHPQLIWFLLRQNQLDEFMSTLEPHHRKEVREMVTCITHQFLAILLIICYSIKLEFYSRLCKKHADSPSLVHIFERMKISDNEERIFKPGKSSTNECDTADMRSNGHPLENQSQELCAIRSTDNGKQMCDKLKLSLEVSVASFPPLMRTVLSSKRHVPSNIDLSEALTQLVSRDEEFNKLIEFVKSHLYELNAVDLYKKFVHGKLNMLDHKINVTPVFRDGKDNVLRVPILDYLRPSGCTLQGIPPK